MDSPTEAMSNLTLDSVSPSDVSFRRESLEQVKISLDMTAAALVNLSLEDEENNDGEDEQHEETEEIKTQTTTDTTSTDTKTDTTTDTTTDITATVAVTATAAVPLAPASAPAPGQAVQVYLRIRPNLVETKEEPCITVLSDTKVQAVAPPSSQSYKTGERGPTELQFSHVFQENTAQEDVFQKAVAPVVDSFLQGNDGLVFAYGITNAGKTYTIRGTDSSPGVLPRALSNIFAQVDGMENVQLQVSHLEIYNEQYYDLLSAPPEKQWTKRPTLKWRNGRPAKLKHVIVTSAEQALEQLSIGSQNRSRAQTALNGDSSRSHSVFSIVIKGLPDVKESVQLSIVDLAGSERAKRTNNRGALLSEAGNINLSLLNLANCFRTIRMNQRNKNSNKRTQQVPYRNSKLTRIFQKSFQGSGQIVMIAAASTTVADYDETVQVLKTAAVTRKVKGEGKSRVQHTNSQYDANGRRRRRRRDGNNPTSSLKHRFPNKRRSLSAEPDVGRRREKSIIIMESSNHDGGRPASLEQSVMGPRPVFMDDSVLLKDDVHEEEAVDLEDYRQEIEDEVRAECAEDMGCALDQQEMELKELYKKKMDAEVKKVMKLLHIAQEAAKVASNAASVDHAHQAEAEAAAAAAAAAEDQEKNHEEKNNMQVAKLQEILEHQKETVQDCEEEIDRYRVEVEEQALAVVTITEALAVKSSELLKAKEELLAVNQEQKRTTEILQQMKLTMEHKETEHQHIIHALQKKVASSKEAVDTLMNQQKELSSVAGAQDSILTTRLEQVEKEMQEQQRTHDEIVNKLEHDVQEMKVTTELAEAAAKTNSKQTAVETAERFQALQVEMASNKKINENAHNAILSELTKQHKQAMESILEKVQVMEMEKKDLKKDLMSAKTQSKDDTEDEQRYAKQLNDATQKIESMEAKIAQQDDEFRIRQENLETEHMMKLSNMRNTQNDIETKSNQIMKKLKAEVTKVTTMQNDIATLEKVVQQKEQRIQELANASMTKTTATKKTTAINMNTPARKGKNKASADEFESEENENTIDLTNTPGTCATIQEEEEEEQPKKKRGGRFAWLSKSSKKPMPTPVARRTRAGRKKVKK